MSVYATVESVLYKQYIPSGHDICQLCHGISAMLRKIRETNIYLKVYEVLNHVFIPEETIIHL